MKSIVYCLVLCLVGLGQFAKAQGKVTEQQKTEFAKGNQDPKFLKEYIEALGYTMDEVMVLGDSLNDYSMISMDFGATVAMGNAVPEIKNAAKYITKTNNEFGVAYAVDEVLKKQGK